MAERERGAAGRRPGPGKGEAYGAAAVAQAIQGVRFPASRGDLQDQVGDKPIQITKGNAVPFREVLDKLPDSRYGSPRDLEREVNAHWPEIRGLTDR